MLKWMFVLFNIRCDAWVQKFACRKAGSRNNDKSVENQKSNARQRIVEFVNGQVQVEYGQSGRVHVGLNRDVRKWRFVVTRRSIFD